MTMKVRCLLMAISLLMVFFVSGTTSSQSSRTFEGCWTFFAAGQCKAIYRDAQNNHYICGNCDASGNPGGGKCSKISQRTLDQGYWCS